ncbi:MAG: hypothetical protein II452_03540 [Paludibacteraceae bacterium]|nr:hypothetical protein [Paludibacteraceae bacterium]
MKLKRLCSILFCVLCSVSAAVCAPADSIYNGTQIKLDIASPILTPALYKWQMQHYELAANVRLAKRFYPTFELGYAGGSTARGDSIAYTGQGGFFRVGGDLNPLKKHPESPHAFLVGVRLGTAVQQFTNGPGLKSGVAADCWGEIVAGCQVEIAKVNNTAFYMGWMGRFKCLFTRELTGMPAADMTAIYIPGFGKRDNIAWGANYYLGWRF